MSILSQAELSGWQIMKMVLRVLGLAILAMARLSTTPSVKRKPDSAQFRVVCGKWVCRLTIKTSGPSRSRSRRSGTLLSEGPSSSSTAITLVETDRRVGDVSSFPDPSAAGYAISETKA